MRNLRHLMAASAAVGAFSAGGVLVAQEMPDIGFDSVGRGAPLGTDVREEPPVGPSQSRGFGPTQVENDEGIYGFRPGNLPEDVEPLPSDIFTSDDFYADRELWSYPRYFRCNSSFATEEQWGALAGDALIESDDPADGAWGHCDIDYPREDIVSPYDFETAEAHYEALLEETRERGGPDEYTFEDFPAGEWNGVYENSLFSTDQRNWYWMMHNQIPTILSLLTPEYQERMVQEAYHTVNTNAPLWPSTFCWPEGFMRRWHMAAVREHFIIANPRIVQISAGVVRNFITNIYVGREFNMDDVDDGGVPRLGEAVPRWYGETIGFWDGEVLITWTSNIQGWKAHSAFEFSSRMQTIEIYTPNRDENGNFTGLNHEAILYDPEALVEPIRIVRNLNKISGYEEPDAEPYPFVECVQSIFPIEGEGTPVSPGQVIEYRVPDMYGRPWAEIWERHHEQGMTGSEEEDIFSFE